MALLGVGDPATRARVLSAPGGLGAFGEGAARGTGAIAFAEGLGSDGGRKGSGGGDHGAPFSPPRLFIDAPRAELNGRLTSARSPGAFLPAAPRFC